MKIEIRDDKEKGRPENSLLTREVRGKATASGGGNIKKRGYLERTRYPSPSNKKGGKAHSTVLSESRPGRACRRVIDREQA